MDQHIRPILGPSAPILCPTYPHQTGASLSAPELIHFHTPIIHISILQPTNGGIYIVMSFNHLSFNISKATPTTSTTNANTTSTPQSRDNNNNLQHHHENVNVNQNQNLNLAKPPPLFQNILAKSSDLVPPKFTTHIGTLKILSEITPATASPTEDSGRSTPKDKTDLIGLFDKFDIDNKTEAEAETDPLTEKFEQFKRGGEQNEVDSQQEDKEHKEEHKEEQEQLPEENHKVKEEHSTGASEKIEESKAEKEHIEMKDSSEKPILDIAHMTIQPYEIPNEGPSINREEEKDHPANKTEPSETDKMVKETVSRSKETTTVPEASSQQSKDLLDIAGSVDEQEPVEEYELKTSDLDTLAAISDKTTTMRPTRSRNNSIRSAQLNLNPKEQYQLSHKPFDFQTFLNHLKKKSADPIVRYIRSFLVTFTKQCQLIPADQKARVINDFKNFINQKFEIYEPFKSMDAIDLENSREGIEKLIMNRLYEYSFSPEMAKKFTRDRLCELTKDDLQSDKDFLLQIEKFNWINGHHLDVDINDLTKFKAGPKREGFNFMEYGITEFNKLNKYRAPRDKIICILNACKIIFSFLKATKQEANADSFIPLLILIIIKAKTDHIISNMHYIEKYRGEEWLNHGETSYYLSSLQGAIGFIQTLGYDKLTISKEEYDAHIEAWDADHKVISPPKPPAIVHPSPQQPGARPTHAGPQQSLSPSTVLLTSAGMFTKSLSNFLSLSPNEAADELPPTDEQNPTNESSNQDQETAKAIKETYKNLKEMFPDLDKEILKDIVYMNQGKLEESLDACLQLAAET